MKRKYRIITIQVERHWVILVAVVTILSLLWFGVSYADQANCSTKNPDIDCTTKGTIDIQTLYTSANWTKTTGLGSHWVVNSQGSYVPQPEFRSGYYHAVCSGINSTCYWHIDKYPATQDLPFGTILHLSDYLTLSTPLASEDAWQLILWVSIVLGITGFLEGVARLVERFLK